MGRARGHACACDAFRRCKDYKVRLTLTAAAGRRGGGRARAETRAVGAAGQQLVLADGWTVSAAGDRAEQSV